MYEVCRQITDKRKNNGKISLQDGFTLKVLGENVYHIPEEEIEAKVPGTVYGTLLDKGLMPDPYFGENELTATKLMENDFEYRKEFFVTEEMTSADGLYLVFEGIDTLSDIYLNEEKSAVPTTCTVLIRLTCWSG